MRRPRTEAGLCPATLLPETTVFDVNPVAARAPRPNRGMSLLGTLLVYGGLATGVVALGHARTADHGCAGTTGPTVVNDLREVEPTVTPDVPPPPPEPVVPAFSGTRPADWQPPVNTNVVPDLTPTTLPLENRAKDSLYNESMPVGPGTLERNPAVTFDPRVRTGEPGGTAKVVEVDFSQVTVTHRTVPTYPAMARLTKVQGPVVLLLTVGTDGRPTDVAVVSGPGQLHGEALRCAREWRFAPATLNGEPVVARFTLTLNFRLQ